MNWLLLYHSQFWYVCSQLKFCLGKQVPQLWAPMCADLARAACSSSSFLVSWIFSSSIWACSSAIWSCRSVVSPSSFLLAFSNSWRVFSSFFKRSTEAKHFIYMQFFLLSSLEGSGAGPWGGRKGGKFNLYCVDSFSYLQLEDWPGKVK